MQKILLSLCLALVFANVKGSYEYHIDDYINLNRIQHENHLKSYDSKLQQFAEQYQDRISAVNLQLELINNELKQTNERLGPLKVLSPFNKECVLKYSDNIPTAFNVQNEMTKCIDFAKIQLSLVLVEAYKVRNELETYCKNSFEQEFKRCAALNDPSEQISCVTNLSIYTNNFIAENKKDFDVKLAAAVCSGENTLHIAHYCSFSVQENASAEISKSTYNIERCISNRVLCKPCIHECNDVLALPAHKFAELHILNPFFNTTDFHQTCVILQKT